MAQVVGTTDSYDLVGIAEDVEDIIYDISPTETPLMTMAARGSIDNWLHQWQTDALDPAGPNRQIEGDDASFVTASPTVMLGNIAQISRKTIIVSRTADKVRKYGRDRETARLIVKRGKEIKRDVEYGLVRDQVSSAGGSGTARSMAGLEAMIGNVRYSATLTTATTPGYAGGGVWGQPVDGTTAGWLTMTETMLKQVIEDVWQEGGDPSVLMMNTSPKKQMAAFAGTAKFAGQYVEGKRTQQGVVVGGVDLYISDHGEHRVKLNRYMKQSTLFALDPEFLEVAWLDRIKPVALAKTGDAEKSMMIGEFTQVVGNPNAHGQLRAIAVA